MVLIFDVIPTLAQRREAVSTAVAWQLVYSTISCRTAGVRPEGSCRYQVDVVQHCVVRKRDPGLCAKMVARQAGHSMRKDGDGTEGACRRAAHYMYGGCPDTR